jgi:hypothetical protein
MIQEFPSYNSFHPIKHKKFEDITSLLKQERKVFKASDVFFGNTDLVSLTETWKLATALFQLLFVITSGKIFPSDLRWGKKLGITDKLFNMERCFINALSGCIEICWYANASNLCDIQIDTYRDIISNTQSHIVILHHVRIIALNKLSTTSWEHAVKLAESKRKKSGIDLSSQDNVLFSSEPVTTSTRLKKTSSKEGVTSKVPVKGRSNVQSSIGSSKSNSGKVIFEKAVPVGPKLGKRFSGTLKFHLLQHFPDQILDFGSIKENVDTSVMESTNIMMSESFERTTKRYESVGKEMIVLSQRNFHIDTSVQLSSVSDKSEVVKDNSIVGIDDNCSFFVAHYNNKKVSIHRKDSSKKWIIKDKDSLFWHPNFNSVSNVHVQRILLIHLFPTYVGNYLHMLSFFSFELLIFSPFTLLFFLAYHKILFFSIPLGCSYYRPTQLLSEYF